MRVIFLDVDGVLNSGAWDAKRSLVGGDLLQPDPAAVIRLLGILQETGAKVVLSSSWRLDPSLIEYLKRHGVPIDDVTPRLDSFGPRADEIRAWLAEHGGDVNGYVIVDDDPDAGVGFSDCFIQTDPRVGLTAADAAKIVGLFT